MAELATLADRSIDATLIHMQLQVRLTYVNYLLPLH